MNWKKLFKKNQDSPYGKEPLFGSSALPLRREVEEQKTTSAPVRFTPTKKEPLEPDWELRRFELAKMIVAQERRSVVLGKLKANDKQIAAKARSIADAAIKELITHPFKKNDESREENE
jgi:hypothetical protein